MKRVFLFCILLIMFCCSVATAETVIKMEYTVITPDYIRDGLYTGEIENGQPQGYGVFEATNSDGIRWHYVGYWVNGLMHGEGGTYWDDGAVEIGIYDHSYMIDGYALDGAAMPTDYLNTAETEPIAVEVTYIGNRNSKKFHYPSCNSVNDMSEKNKITIVGRDNAISMGYEPCKVCNP